DGHVGDGHVEGVVGYGCVRGVAPGGLVLAVAVVAIGGLDDADGRRVAEVAGVVASGDGRRGDVGVVAVDGADVLVLAGLGRGGQIGRAACREGGEVVGVGVCV